MDVRCGMCGESISVPKDMKGVPKDMEGDICVPCQDYTLGYLYPVPVMADGGE